MDTEIFPFLTYCQLKTFSDVLLTAMKAFVDWFLSTVKKSRHMTSVTNIYNS